MTDLISPTTAPPEDSDQTWHVHDDGTWGWGAICPVCTTRPIETDGKIVHFGIHHLKEQNRDGWTVREKQREIEDGAREDGRDITRV